MPVDPARPHAYYTLRSLRVTREDYSHSVPPGGDGAAEACQGRGTVRERGNTDTEGARIRCQKLRISARKRGVSQGYNGRTRLRRSMPSCGGCRRRGGATSAPVVPRQRSGTTHGQPRSSSRCWSALRSSSRTVSVLVRG